MAFLKCKMCGGSLEIQDGAATCECEYCGSVQTVPVNQDENVRNLFNRANSLRMKAEFDKAAEIYEKILQIASSESEAYWGLILCRYGVEYVEDPKTMKRIPTCHRASYEAITADDDYKNALKYADTEQKKLYEEEARSIDEIQKGILAVSQKEEPYDVFICYKETDENGKRTQDSVIANDIYYQLSREGYKVFFAAITLETKLGTEYEPYIFSALNTARVMLVIGTKPEYFHAAWVRNEWSRFLAIMKKDRTKMLIPCYRDMDAYDLPEEFSHLQAQDMSKIGFINDLVRGIQKVIIKKKSNPEVAEEKRRESSAVNTDALLKRALLSLEDKDWSRANEFCEQVLNSDPENPYAYLYQLMAKCKLSKREQLSECAKPFDDNNLYKKAIRFADIALQRELESDIRIIKERNEENRKKAIYENAMSLSQAEDSYSINNALNKMKSISGWKDADEKVREISDRYNAVLAEEKRINELYKEKQRIEEEKRKQRINELNLKYDEQNYILVNKKNETERKLKEISNQVTKMDDQISKKRKRLDRVEAFLITLFMLGMGLFGFIVFIYILGFMAGGSIHEGAYTKAIMIGSLIFAVSVRVIIFALEKRHSSKIKMLDNLRDERDKVSNELSEIEKKIAMLSNREQYIANAEKDFLKADQ